MTVSGDHNSKPKTSFDYLCVDMSHGKSKELLDDNSKDVDCQFTRKVCCAVLYLLELSL